MRVACLGDVMLDVIVQAPHGLVPDDDTPATITLAPGGQAANVAVWVAALGGTARVYGPRSAQAEAGLAQHGVALVGPSVRRAGAVMSLVTGGTRSLASDPGDLSWLARIAPGDWLDGLDWLFVSGYALLRAPDPDRLVTVAETARRRGAAVAVDLASAAMIRAHGPARFLDLWQSLEPAVVLANDAEWAATHHGLSRPPARPGAGAGGRRVLVLKHGARGAGFVIDGVADERPPLPGPVVDTTGAGDALTAGYLVAGADLAMRAAARCVAHLGAQPDPA